MNTFWLLRNCLLKVICITQIWQTCYKLTWNLTLRGCYYLLLHSKLPQLSTWKQETFMISQFFFPKFLNVLNRSIVDLQCRVKFQVYNKVIHLYTHILFFIFFSIIGHYKVLTRFPVLYSWSLLFILWIVVCICLLIPNSWCISLPLPLW